MSFAEPIWLYLTPILLLLFGGMLVYGFQRRDALLARFAASRLLDQLTEKAGLTRTWIKAGGIILAVVAIGIALARPQLGVEFSERKSRGLDIVFVLDSSKSMLATDLRPTRLDRAKLAIIDLIQRLESDRIGLIAFAGQAFLQTPPTLDYAAFRESLDAIDPNIMTSGGSDLGNALNEATKAFPSENNVKVVVLLTDGEDLGGNALKAAEDARAEGIQVFAIGIGTPEGEYLKIRNNQDIEEFVRDADGQPVRSQLDEATLQQIAQITSGTYSRLSGDSLDQLYRTVLATLPREERESELKEIKIERFQWALSAALIFLVLEILIRRRRSAAIHAALVILALLTLNPTDAQAQTSENETIPAEGQTAIKDARSLYNSAYEALSSGDYEQAATLYGSALAQTSDLALQRDALYNMGHAAYQQGRSSYESGDPQTALEQVKKAEELFNSAQQIDPGDTSISSDLQQVTKVRETIEKLVEQQQKQEQSDQQDQSEQSDQQDQSEQQDSSKQSDQKQQDQQPQDQSEQSDQKQQDQQPQDQSEQSDSNQQGQQPQDQSEQQDPSESSNPSDQTDQSNPSDPSDQAAQDSQDSQNNDQTSPQESTQNPVDDIPQPQPGEESEEPGEQDQQPVGMPESSEGEAAEGQGTTGTVSGEQIEGMTEAEAAALLDSLRGRETLLPFMDQQRSGRNRDTRDW